MFKPIFFPWRFLNNKYAVKVTFFTDQQLECHQDCAYFTREEILTHVWLQEYDGKTDVEKPNINYLRRSSSVFEQFRDIDVNKIPRIMSDEECRKIRVPRERLEENARSERK